jgi:cytochrome c2
MMRTATAAIRRNTPVIAMQAAALAGLMLLVVAVTTAHAAPAPTPTGGPGGQGYLDTISAQFQAATTGWMTTAQGYAFKIFTALAAMDLSWWGIKQVLKKNDLADFIAGATLKIASIAFFYTIVKYAPTWMPLITSSFMDMGQAIGGSSAATASPSGVMSMAFSVVHQLYEVYNKAPGGLLNIGSNLFLAIIIAWSIGYVITSYQPGTAHVKPLSYTQLLSMGQGIVTTTCEACHTVNGSGGVIGPDLNQVLAGKINLVPGGKPTNQKWLVEWISDPPAVWSGAKMPNLGLQPQQVQAVVDYLEKDVK